MEGKVCLVTGATSGIGLATARGLAERGATVISVGRDAQKGARTVAQIQEQSGNPSVEFLLADLSVQAQVRDLAAEFKGRHQRLDVLINNAGGFYIKRRLSADGIEMTLALNLLAPFLLTHLLLDRLKASAPARILNVSSDMHKSARLDLEDLELAEGYSGMRAYGQSKLGLVLLTYEFARRLAGTGVTANALHPGFVDTGINQGSGCLFKAARPFIKLLAKSPEEGAETSLYLATAPEVADVSGAYFVKEEAVASAPATYDEALAQRLWAICARMTGIG
jgi:NAD(P)-dependent dehydrogenase (short-subunit alcohol dehydrogenase family)